MCLPYRTIKMCNGHSVRLCERFSLSKTPMPDSTIERLAKQHEPTARAVERLLEQRPLAELERDQLLAVDAMNDPRAYMVGKRLIDAGKTADPAVVADPAADLKPLLKA